MGFMFMFVQSLELKIFNLLNVGDSIFMIIENLTMRLNLNVFCIVIEIVNNWISPKYVFYLKIV